jgi:hypothetical protein
MNLSRGTAFGFPISRNQHFKLWRSTFHDSCRPKPGRRRTPGPYGLPSTLYSHVFRESLNSTAYTALKSVRAMLCFYSSANEAHSIMVKSSHHRMSASLYHRVCMQLPGDPSMLPFLGVLWILAYETSMMIVDVPLQGKSSCSTAPTRPIFVTRSFHSREFNAVGRKDLPIRRV